jgi:signal transduction histidine kinase
MSPFAFISVFATLAGTAILALALVFGLKIKKSVPREVSGQWAIVLSMMAAFIICYLGFVVIIVLGVTIAPELLAGSIFLGGAIYVLVIIRLVQATVHRLREAESETRESYDLLQNALNAIANPILIVDASDNHIVVANEAAARQTGGDPIALGLTCHQAMNRTEIPWDDESGFCLLKKVIASGDTLETTHTCYDREGNILTFSVTATPMFGPDGKVVEVIEIYRDVTAQRMTSEAAARHTRDLEEANQFNVLFTDILSHDLRNPIAVIKGCESTLAGGETDDKRTGLHEMMERNIRRVEGMIENASKYTRLRGMEEIERQPVDLAGLLRETVENLRGAWEAKGMTIAGPGEGEYPAPVNPLMEDVFQNLLSNAISYSPEKSRIEIEIADAGDQRRISFRDAGPGIPDENKEKIFARFERLGDGRVKGQGLGLAIVRRIVELHGGKVRVENNPDKGSTFIVDIPAT